MKQYLATVQDILDNGNARGDRTGTGTISKFGPQMRFNLKEGFPIVTTKFVPIRVVAEELRWIIRGSTNNNELRDVNVHIWDAWALQNRIPYTVEERYELLRESMTEEEFSAVRYEANPLESDEETRHGKLDVFKIPRDYAGPGDGDLGPVYGRQWRQWPKAVWHTTRRPATTADMIKDALVLQNYDLAIKLVELERMMATGEAHTQQTAIHDLDAMIEKAGLTGIIEERTLQIEYIDQLAELIDGLKTRPFSRRHIISAWNPADMPVEGMSHKENVEANRQALPPCHTLFQFYVSERPIHEIREEAGEELWAQLGDWQKTLVSGVDYTGSTMNVDYSNISMKWLEDHGVKTKQLSCQLYQRSADMFLGVPFNISSYSLLLAMVAQCVGMVPFEFVHTFGDAHIYANHMEQFDIQLARQPKALPKLWLNPEITNIEDFKIEDIRLEGYEHDPTIKAPVAV